MGFKEYWYKTKRLIEEDWGNRYNWSFEGRLKLIQAQENGNIVDLLMNKCSWIEIWVIAGS